MPRIVIDGERAGMPILVAIVAEQNGERRELGGRDEVKSAQAAPK
jgi:hypothetical protein